MVPGANRLTTRLHHVTSTGGEVGEVKKAGQAQAGRTEGKWLFRIIIHEVRTTAGASQVARQPRELTERGDGEGEVSQATSLVRSQLCEDRCQLVL